MLNQSLNSTLVATAANENNTILRKYKILNKGLVTLESIGGINRALANSLDRTMKGAISNRLNISGFTEEVSQVGYETTKRLLKKKMSLAITQSNYRDNLRCIESSITADRLAEVVGILDVIGNRDNIATEARPISIKHAKVISDIYRDLQIDTPDNDQDSLTGLGSVEVKGGLRTKVTKLLTNVKLGLEAVDGIIVTPEITAIKQGDVLAVRAFARICGNLKMLVNYI